MSDGTDMRRVFTPNTSSQDVRVRDPTVGGNLTTAVDDARERWWEEPFEEAEMYEELETCL